MRDMSVFDFNVQVQKFADGEPRVSDPHCRLFQFRNLSRDLVRAIPSRIHPYHFLATFLKEGEVFVKEGGVATVQADNEVLAFPMAAATAGMLGLKRPIVAANYFADLVNLLLFLHIDRVGNRSRRVARESHDEIDAL